MSLTTESGIALINQALAAAPRAPAAAPMVAPMAAAGAPGGNFCSLWPTAKPLLELAAKVLPLIPGVGAIAGPILEGLIKIGDQLHADSCT